MEQEECNRLQKEAEDALKKQKLQELIGLYMGLYWDNGKENENYYSIIGYILGYMEKKMEATKDDSSDKSTGQRRPWSFSLS